MPTHIAAPRGTTPVDNVHAAIEALTDGRIVVVIVDDNSENEGDLVLAAESVTATQMAFVVAHTTGIVCAPMSGERADLLGLPPMVADNRDAHGTAFTVSVDHVDTGTGVAASARARTCRALADPDTTAAQLRRPGHIFPLRARSGGVLGRVYKGMVDGLRDPDRRWQDAAPEPLYWTYPVGAATPPGAVWARRPRSGLCQRGLGRVL
ncbi:3,4-dihydroxy-2-butanone-4-phosphate synthase [Pseudonocardia sp. GCM10023141]|uniref:3,4-dihydroxy-2-butanone-4-phosphate synthase n=1 Tax=Pseudonocardia sp. GCM10023141 TaxID=3252653 RepID=UPI00361B7792